MFLDIALGLLAAVDERNILGLVFLAAGRRARARVRVVRGLLVVRVHGQPRRELVVVRVAEVELEDVDAQVDHLVRDVEHVELVGGDAHVVVQHDVGEHLGRARVLFSWFIYNATTTNTSLINAGRDMYFILLSPAIASS